MPKASAFDKDAFLAGYLSYNNEVREYFGTRDDFLELNVCGSEGWKKLCPFLDVPIPDVPFPHRNRQNYKDD